ncbi:HAD family hydrolase [Nocardia sp. NBC_01009]|uniref:HAD family hydrolase n=1 Tax=Nocardia sp. NBC_01009 TaxID=2975996 RepID=UPI00386C1AA9|nr:HAD hydrolase family protein [Nocardia sp. NBC_01009]
MFRRRLGVSADDTLAVGDGTNDLEMLAWAAHGVAMGEAPAVVCAVADEVCPPVTRVGWPRCWRAGSESESAAVTSSGLPRSLR